MPLHNPGEGTASRMAEVDITAGSAGWRLSRCQGGSSIGGGLRIMPATRAGSQARDEKVFVLLEGTWPCWQLRLWFWQAGS